MNVHNHHQWVCYNPHGAAQSRQLHELTVNVWAGLVSDCTAELQFRHVCLQVATTETSCQIVSPVYKKTYHWLSEKERGLCMIAVQNISAMLFVRSSTMPIITMDM
jgi:hypothetical protein